MPSRRNQIESGIGGRVLDGGAKELELALARRTGLVVTGLTNPDNRGCPSHRYSPQ